jgi:phage gp29-like protein
LFTKKFAVLASGWQIEVEKPSKAVEKMKSFIEFNLAEMQGTVESWLRDVLTALDYGYSISEPCYRVIEYGEFANLRGLAALKVRRPDQIEFELDQFGNLSEFGVLQGQKRLPAARFAIFTYRPEFGNLYGTSDLREAHRAWFCKQAVTKFALMSLERYGQPIAVAKTSTTLNDSEKNVLLQMLKNLQSRSALVIPATIDLDFATPTPHVAEAFIPMLDKLDRWIAMAILMPSLLGMGGGADAVGSLARSETEQDTFLWVIEQLRNDLQEFVNDRVVKVLCDLNFEVTDGVYPCFKFKELTHERKLEVIDLYNKALSSTATTKTRDDEEFVRGLIGLPELPRHVAAVGTREDEIEKTARRERQMKKAIFGDRVNALPLPRKRA